MLVFGIGHIGVANIAAGQGANQSTLTPDTAYTIVSQDANKQIWEKTSYELAPNGSAVPKIHRYTEMASGLNYMNSEGQWVPSQEIIEPSANGAVAQQGQYRVIFANNLNTTGSIDQQTPDGKRLQSNILGLEYYDPTTGQSAVIAQVQDSQGELISANQILYPDAFQGVKADVRYTYKKGSFEQDVILREQLPTPESYGLSSGTTVLEVMTEFINPPTAQTLVHQFAGNSLADEDVSWGIMGIGQGKAFELGSQQSSGIKVQVFKEYTEVQGRQILFEKVPVSQIQSALSGLPLQSSIKSHTQRMAGKIRIPPQTPLAKAKTGPMKLASKVPSGHGFVLDYVEIDTVASNWTFQGDHSYLINGEVYMMGNVIIEGNTVIKYGDDTNNPSKLILWWGELSCETGPYRPAVFTSRNDDSVGENMDDGGEQQFYQAFWDYTDHTDQGNQLHYIRVSYATYGVEGFNIHLGDSQFVNCQYPLIDEWGACNLTNVLLVNSGTAFYGLGYSVHACQVTIDGCTNGQLSADWSGATNDPVSFVNCLLVNVGTNGNAIVSTNCTARFTGSSSTVFQTAVGGCHYLPTNSPYCGVGTTNIDTAILAELGDKTTFAPVVYSNATISASTTFNPCIARDTNGAPNLGYHYDALDYVFAETEVDSNVTFAAGTAVGWFRTTSGWYEAGDGLHLMNQATANFNGTASSPCWWIHLNTVQEEEYSGGYGPGGLTSWGSGPSGYVATINCQFLKCSGMNGDANHFRDDGCCGGGYLVVNALNSEFYGINVGGYILNLNFTNCLFCRTAVGVNNNYANCGLVMQNCTMLGGDSGDVGVTHSGSGWPVYIVNCAFENCSFSGISDTNNSHFDYNSYLQGDSQLPAFGAHDVVVTSELGYNWQGSWLGNFYLPSGSPLIQAGNTNANFLGLANYTTQTNQIPEGSLPVDIGYHYLAMASPYPVISQQPTNQGILAGGSVELSVSATGPGLLDYEWYFDGVEIIVSNYVTTVAGAWNPNYYGNTGDSGDGGLATNAALNLPTANAMDAAGNLYIADAQNNVIRKVDTNGVMWTVAGNNHSGAGYTNAVEAATNVTLSLPQGVAVDGSGNIYIADSGNGVVRKVNTSGMIATIAGNGTNGYSGNGVWATNAELNSPFGVAVDSGGNVYIADSNNSLIRKVDTNGWITTVAGNYSLGWGYSGDGGAATNAKLNAPYSVAVDSGGNLYIADSNNNVIRKVGTNGIITTVAGNSGGSFSGDGGAATNAQIGSPCGVAVDVVGNIYIPDTYNNVIRFVNTNGIITTVAGNTVAGYNWPSGLATAVELNTPAGGCMDSHGNYIFCDAYNNVVRSLTLANFNGTISNGVLTIANANANQAGNYQVIVSNPYGSTNSSEATLSVYTAPMISCQPTNQTAFAGDDIVYSVIASGMPAPVYQWYFNGTNFLGGATNSVLTIYNIQTYNVGNYSVVVTNSGGAVTSSVVALTISNPSLYTVLDGSYTNFVFQGDMTYYVNSTVQLFGATVVEGGTVVKYGHRAAAELSINGPLVDHAASYRPAIFTSKDDNLVGQVVSQSTGNPVLTNDNATCLVEAVAQTNGYVDLRVCYFSSGIVGHGAVNVWDSQFISCGTAVGSAGGGNISLHNVLISQAANCVMTTGMVQAENVTADQCQAFCPAGYGGADLTNCILTAVANTNGVALVSSISLSGGSGVYQTVCGGNYYLALGTYRGVGTANVSSILLADLADKTTYPPTIVTNTITTNTVFGRQTARNSGLPDLGYHYDALDYIVSCVVSNASVILTNGVALAYVYSDWSGGTFYWLGGVSLSSQGTAAERNYIVPVAFVQEGVWPIWTTSGMSHYTAGVDTRILRVNQSNTNLVPSLSFNFTTIISPSWSEIGIDGYGVWNLAMQNCETYCNETAWNFDGLPVCTFTNNLFVYPNLLDESTGQMDSHNNLFVGDVNSYELFVNDGTNSWVNQDNAFDNGQSYMDGVIGHNAYLNGAYANSPIQANDVITNLAWQTSWFGNYYQPSNSPLIGAGSTNASLLGLYDFTTQTNQVKEGNSIVTIGYHYVATDADGNPVDSNGDGIPDYLEDVNGNGISGQGQTPFGIIIDQPVSGTVIY